MTSKPDPASALTPEAIAASAARYQSRAAWQRGDPAAYSAAKRLGLSEAVCKHMRQPPRDLTLEVLIASAAPYASRTEWKKADPSAYISAHRRGLLDVVCAHMTRKIPPSGYWTLERCAQSAAAYTSRVAWAKAAPGAYNHARRNGWLDRCCAHMPKYQHAPMKWTPEQIAASAQRFSSKTAWHRQEHGAYSAAKRLGIFDEVTAHMTNHGHQRNQPSDADASVDGADASPE